jgi:hypothetical protein
MRSKKFHLAKMKIRILLNRSYNKTNKIKMKLPWIKDNKTKIKKLYKYNVFKSKKTNKIYNKNLKISQYSINWSKS